MKETDYRYIMENMSVLQIGAKYSYRELVDDIDLSYKYRCIIKQLLLQEVDADTTIESHLYYMKPQDESCRIYRQLRAKIRIYVPRVKKHLGGRTDTEYPNLEFRYCSKCNGYYCYCIDHINNHVHIQ